jgi:hypothetical protein
MNQRTKVQLCAQFLARCLSYGWKKTDLDELERMWWKGEAWKHTREYKAMESICVRELPG